MHNNTQQVKISDVIAELGIPANSKFLGYAVHKPDSDEFLMVYEEKDGAERWLWAKTPNLTYLYHDFHQALSHSDAYEKHPSQVGLLFDIGDQFFFASRMEAT